MVVSHDTGENPAAMHDAPAKTLRSLHLVIEIKMTFKSSYLAKDEDRFPAQPVDDEDQKDVRGDLDERSEDEGDVDVAAQVDRVEAEPVGPHGRRYPVGEQDQRVGGHCSI